MEAWQNSVGLASGVPLQAALLRVKVMMDVIHQAS